jgi:hypothetical protein
MNGHSNGKISNTVEDYNRNEKKCFGDLAVEMKKSAVICEQEFSRKKTEDESRLPAIEAAYSIILRELGEDTDRQGLLRTPLRAAKAMQFLTKGYHENVNGEFKTSWRSTTLYNYVIFIQAVWLTDKHALLLCWSTLFLDGSLVGIVVYLVNESLV